MRGPFIVQLGSNMACTECGGKHPWWDHGPVKSFGEQPMEPTVDWNITSDLAGKEFTTRSERRKYMDKHALEYKEKVQAPGGVQYFDRKSR